MGKKHQWIAHPTKEVLNIINNFSRAKGFNMNDLICSIMLLQKCMAFHQRTTICIIPTQK